MLNSKSLEARRSSAAVRKSEMRPKVGIWDRFKQTAAAGALGLTLAFGGMTFSHGTAKAQPMEIAGQKVEVELVDLKKPISVLEKETKPFDRGENIIAGEGTDTEYIRTVIAPEASFMVNLKKDGTAGLLVCFDPKTDKVHKINEEEEKGLTKMQRLLLRKAGKRAYDITIIVSIAEALSGKKVERFEILIADRGTYDHDNNNRTPEIPHVTAHIYPLDKEGNRLTKFNNGYLVSECSQYDGEAYAGPSLVFESKETKLAEGRL